MIGLIIFSVLILYFLGFICKIFNFSQDTFNSMAKWTFILLIGAWFAYCAVS